MQEGYCRREEIVDGIWMLIHGNAVAGGEQTKKKVGVEMYVDVQDYHLFGSGQ